MNEVIKILGAKLLRERGAFHEHFSEVDAMANIT